MDESVRMLLVVGTVALCAIVGVYYVGARKRSQAEGQPPAPPAVEPPQAVGN
jgi:hypothetical protein